MKIVIILGHQVLIQKYNSHDVKVVSNYIVNEIAY